MPSAKRVYCSYECRNEFYRKTVIIVCPCGKEVKTIPSLIGRKKHCSKACGYKYMPKKEPRTYIKHTCSVCSKVFMEWAANKRMYCSIECRSKNANYKGDAAGYDAIHSWIRRRLGTPRECAHCYDISAKKYEWANISGTYSRDLSDWVRLCVLCHYVYDGKQLKIAESILATF